MDNKERLERKTIVWIIVVGLLAGLVILWLIPLENRDLKFVFRTMNKNYSFEKSHDDLPRSFFQNAMGRSGQGQRCGHQGCSACCWQCCIMSILCRIQVLHM